MRELTEFETQLKLKSDLGAKVLQLNKQVIKNDKKIERLEAISLQLKKILLAKLLWIKLNS